MTLSGAGLCGSDLGAIVKGDGSQASWRAEQRLLVGLHEPHCARIGQMVLVPRHRLARPRYGEEAAGVVAKRSERRDEVGAGGTKPCFRALVGRERQGRDL